MERHGVIMEKFYLESPSLKRKEEAINFINEFYAYNSNINGTGGLRRYLDDYESWLVKLDNELHTEPTEEKVPAVTYFLIRQNDNKIVGMINIRLALNERLRNSSGNIGYCIRPTERGKGYNKINLYLGLQKAKEFGIEEVLLDAEVENPASWKTMDALGGQKIREGIDPEDNTRVVFYTIPVDESLEKYKQDYQDYLISGTPNL